ncbi:MAG: GAF domain-containing protein [Balneolaceae bacterium]
MGRTREDKALREFKHILRDLVFMLRQSTGAETVHMHWVNRARKQFVMEANSTSLSRVMFQDRVSFEGHFLYPQKDLQKIVQLRPGEDLDISSLTHYYGDPPVRQCTVIPFVNNRETVALTVVETADPILLSRHEPAIQAYTSAMENVLNTYLELTDLYEKQQEWILYEESLEKISTRLHKVEILHRMLNEMQKLLPGGGASLVARGMDVWINVLNSGDAAMPPALGLMIDEKSIAYDSLKSGSPEFAIHFNQNPKRLTATESDTEGATLAIPIMIDDRRQGTVLAYDRNALIFKESVKHKLVNLVRTSTLAIRANLGSVSADEDLLTCPYSSFIPDVWEKAVDTTLSSRHPLRNTWFGFITIVNLQTLRSRYRLEELKRLQKTLVRAFNPSSFGINGYIGFHSDYVFAFLLQDVVGTTPENWISSLNQMLSKPVSLNNGRQVEVEIAAGYTQVEGERDDFHPVVREAKTALSEAVKQSVLFRNHADTENRAHEEDTAE